MSAFVAANPRGRHGTVAYDLSAFGLDADEIRHRLKDYSDRWDLRDEGLR